MDIYSLSKEIRWNIHSFINDIELNKEKYSEVIAQLKLRTYYSNNVLIRIKAGTRAVAEDQFGKCPNCYHFGKWKQFNSDMKMGIRVCAYHKYEDKKNMKVSYMSFDEFMSNSYQLMMHYESYEEYDMETTNAFQPDEDRHFNYLDQVDRNIIEYNNSVNWSW